MDVADSPDVLEEVEALFKKLQHLPESVRKKALSCIQEKLPDAHPAKTLDVKSSAKVLLKHGKGGDSAKDSPQTPNPERRITRKETARKESAVSDSAEVAKTRKSKNEESKTCSSESVPQGGTVSISSPHSSQDKSKSPVQEDVQLKKGQSKEKVKLPYRLRVKQDLLDSSSDEPKGSQFDETTNTEFLLEDVKTLHGRRTKRINAANLIKGIRKARVIPSTPVKSATSPAKKDIVLEKRPRNIPMKKTPVPSDVAESAEILASLSNEISQKDLTQGATQNVNVDQTDCLKDKTNSQGAEETTSTGIVSSASETPTITVKLEPEPLMIDSQQDELDDEYVLPDNSTEEDESSKNDFSCHFCEFKSSTKSALSAHVRKHKENIPKAPFTCSECNKTFSQSCGLQLHLKRHRNERDFPCEHCEYKAFTKVDLTRHQTIHTGERNKICEFCGKAFAKDSTLRDHVKAIHERKVKHECEVCGFVTHRANNLRVHIRMRHHGEYNNHVCPVCGASVKQKNAFLEHMRSHTGERPYKCQECTASFACLARLNVHRNAVHGERLFKCGDCDKTFQTKHHLLRHHAIHTKERPYACPFCTYACNTQGNIAKHVRSIHNCPDFSYRKYKTMQENGGQPREVDPEWVRKGEEVTKEYLNTLSEKLGRPITLDELWQKEEEMKKKREEQEKARLALKEQKAAKAEASGSSFLSKVRKRRSDERRNINRKGKAGLRETNLDDVDDPSALLSGNETDGERSELPFYKLVSQGGNIQLCLETDEVQVYTGDATRELSLLHMSDEDVTSNNEIQTIQGYMNEHGEFIRLDEGVMVNEDSSTVVVIIDSEMNEGLTPEVADVMEITCEEEGKEGESNKRTIEYEVNTDNKRKKSVLRVIKQED